MRLILIYLIFSSGTVFSRYSEKRHFDRSVYDDTKLLIRDKYLPKKQWIFSDYDTNFKAYKDKEDNICYLEKMDDSTAVEDLSAYGRQEQISKIFYASTDTLTKLEAWRIAGGRIIAFCHGRKLILLQNTMPVFGETTNPFLNVIPQDENDIAVRRVADVVLTPLISRTKRQIILEERERLIENSSRTRTRRQAQQPRGRFRGQTQSQYLSIDSEDQKEGKAEAEATQQSSRAVVSGSRGMGQAQSMSVGNNGCEECPKYTNEGAPDRYVQYPSAGSFIQPGVITPGNNADTTFTRGPLPRGPAYPDNITPTGDTTPGNIVRGGADYPGGVPSIMPTGGRVTYPTGTIGTTTKESGVSYPGSLPGTTTGGGVVYPGSVPGITSGGAVTYPGGVPGSTAGGGVSYPGGIPGPTAGGEISYPGGVPGPTAGGGVSYPGGVPGSTAGGGVTYPSGVPRTTSGAGSDYPAGIPGRTDSGTYPGGIPGTRITEGGVSYPSGAPGTVMTGPGISYPAGVPGRTDSGVTYAGGIPGTRITEGGVSYPSGAPSTVMTGPGVTYPGSVPGTRISDGQVSYPLGVPSARITGGGVSYPSGVPGTRITEGGVSYPSGVPGTRITEGGVSYPSGVPGTRITEGGVSYPSGLPGTITTGDGTVYFGSVPGSPITGGGVVYPGGIPGTTTGHRIAYPGGAPGTTTTGGGVVYPGGVPGSPTTGGGVVYPGGVSGSPTTGGGVVYPGGVPGSPTTGGGVVYPGGVPDTVASRNGVVYPSGIPGTTTGGGTIYPGGLPGTTTTGGGITYPSGMVPGSRTDTRGQIITESKATADTKIYPGQISGFPYPGVIVPGQSPSDTGGRTITTNAEGAVPYSSGILPPGHLRETVQYPGRVIPQPTNVNGITPETSGVIHTGIGTYPGGTVPRTPGSLTGQINYPGIDGTNVITTGSNTGTMIPYPQGTQFKHGQGVYHPGMQVGPDGRVIHYPGTPGTVPSGYSVQEQHPGVATWHDGQGQTISDMTGRHVNGGSNRQGEYLSEGQNIRQQYPTGMRPANAGEISQYYQQAASAPTVEDDNSNSQASSSVKQTDSGTQASASSQGTYGEGTAQSQVTGTYSGSGSFSAQAGSSDTNKNAQTEISGGKEGATSNAQGAGGYGKSQAQVQLDSESGATSTGAQSNGWNHGTNSQVQASSRGGMADAQANGEGSTSSQAQIGFQPYLKTDEKLERHAKPFRGGGTASAQSGMHRGQSQSQLEGSFQYGITYTGAAQAGSGSGAAASRKPFKFNLTETELFKPFEPYNTPQITKSNGSSVTNTSSGADYEYNQEKPPQGLQSSSSSRRTVIANATKEVSQNVAGKQTQSGEKSQVDDTMYDYDEEYGDYDASQTQTSTDAKYSKNYIADQNNSDHQSQMIQVTTGNQYDVHVHQDSNTPQLGDRLQPGQSLPGYTIPPGFRGRVKSVAGDETTAHGDGKSQSQTVSLIPRIPNTAHETKSPNSETRSLKTNHERLAEDHALSKEEYNFSRFRNHQTSTDYSKPATVPMKPSYYTVTNSFAGKMDGSKNSHKKYEHRYYTKSSTCGYFTFSCNVVYGSNGRTKICKPKMPTHPDGTPVKC
ncbi:PREDICTED: uncharacterized protein LOC107186487 [Dufourea novaeangliae]|uniref:uncharacterized protein LOC107186487 n=1 Tax=Dufourea novaeangliae TaxID=178035 RepID=UPI00076701A8|nr:PREDICTED: uncharacterized protein LOC107186487 [Dufourea novaeangliae]